MKKKAIRIGIIFIIVVIACIFVSRTIVSLTTPKAEFTEVKKNSVVDLYRLDGRFVFIEETPLYWTETADYPVEIVESNMRVGQSVKVGKVLATAKLPARYDAQVLALENQLNALLVSKAQYLNSVISSKTDLEGTEAEATRAYLVKETEVSLKRAEMINILKNNELIENDEEIVSENRIITLWESMDDAETMLVYQELNVQLEEALTALNKQLKKGNNMEFSLTLSWDSLMTSIAQTENELADLYALADNLTEYVSDIEGVITAVNVQVGQTYSGSQPICSVDVTGTPQIIVPLVGKSAKEIDSMNIFSFQMDGESFKCRDDGKYTDKYTGEEYLVFAPENKFWDGVSNVRTILNSDVMIDSENSLGYFDTVPTSALMGSEDNYFIYVAMPASGFWGDEYHVIKDDVEVVALSETLAGITGFDSNIGRDNYLLTQWDKPLRENQRVMQYVKIS